jgi:hypothetical protein
LFDAEIKWRGAARSRLAMLVILLISLLVGAVLGQRFKVLVLIPATALTVMAGTAFAHADTFWQILGAALVATTSLQIGYFAGAGIRYLMAMACTTRMDAGSPAVSISSRRAAN